MSEYQYYEFVAVDRPLTTREMAELRALSTRARITPTRFVNEYHWGDFKGNPDRLMEKYFDAHVYFANWGSRVLMLRLPGETLSLRDARRFLGPRRDAAWSKGGFTIIQFGSENDSGEDMADEGGSDWLSSLLPLRATLASGDLGPLYLAWLARVQAEDVPDDEPEPADPPGVLTASLKSLADFLRVDARLLPAVAKGRKGKPRRKPDAGLPAAISKLPSKLKDGLLLKLTRGEGAVARDTLMRSLRRAAPTPAPSAPRRTAGDLMALLDDPNRLDR